MASTTSRTNDPDRRSDADRGRSPAASRSSRAWAPTQSERPRPSSSASAAVFRGARRSSSSRLGSARGSRTRPSRFVARTTASSSCPWTRYPRPSPRILWSRACHVTSSPRGSAVRWSDARNAVPFGALALAVVSVGPGRVDSTPLVPLALIFVAASAVALSVARSAEELSLTTGTSGPARLSSANSVVFALGVGALLAALAAPLVDQLLRDLGEALAPTFDEIVFTLLLPIGYLAALVYALLEPLLRRWNPFSLPSQGAPSDDVAMLRNIERTRPLVVGGVEIVVVIVVLLVALVLFERAVRERRLTLPDGAELERAAASGLTLGATLRSLFPRGSARRRAPRDDGTPAAAVRIIYWRLLALADHAGQGWRAAAETPSGHQMGITGVDPRWGGASPIVAAFEGFRFGGVAPGPATIARARDARRAVGAAVRT